jgi:hypothetical protein
MTAETVVARSARPGHDLAAHACRRHVFVLGRGSPANGTGMKHAPLDLLDYRDLNRLTRRFGLDRDVQDTTIGKVDGRRVRRAVRHRDSLQGSASVELRLAGRAACGTAPRQLIRPRYDIAFSRRTAYEYSYGLRRCQWRVKCGSDPLCRQLAPQQAAPPHPPSAGGSHRSVVIALPAGLRRSSRLPPWPVGQGIGVQPY